MPTAFATTRLSSVAFPPGFQAGAHNAVHYLSAHPAE